MNEELETAEDNIEAAMDAVADSLVPTRKSNTGAKKGEQAQNQVLYRATAEDHERLKMAAQHMGISMAEFIRSAVNEKVADTLDCKHPENMRKTYPWNEKCLKCGATLRNGDNWGRNPRR